MSTDNPPNRAALRAFVVLFLAAVVLGYSLPDLRRVWQPLGKFGVTTSFPDQIVTGLDSGSPAEKAGLKIGDRIDVAATAPNYRYLVAYSPCSPCTPLPSQEVTMAVERDQRVRNIRLVSEPEPLNTFTKTLIVGRELQLLLFLGIGAALVLLRPSMATWAFYIYCVGQNGAPDTVLPMILNVPLNYFVNNFLQDALFEAGTVGIAVFAVLFLHEQSAGWRAAILRLAPFAFLVLVGLDIYVFFLAVGWFGWPAQTALNLYKFLEDAVLIGALCAFIANYISARGTDRQRIRWVVLGFGIALASNVALTTIPALGTPHLYWLYSTLMFAPVVVPLTVAYAVVKHRIIDVSFVVSRTLVYGILTSLLVGAFALIDWLFIDKLKLARLGTIAEMGVAVAGGFWFNGLHKRVDTLIDATFFRQRHRAEVQLARNAAALPSATTIGAVAQALVTEPVRTLSLASAALFRRGKDGRYVREESEGWATSDISRLDDKDAHFLMLLQTENGPLSLHDHPWRTERVPSGPAHPALALPIIVRRELAAVVFYGAHIHGEGLDPDEMKAIASLAPGAAAAYDLLDAKALQKKNESLQSEVESLRTQLAETQIQPA